MRPPNRRRGRRLVAGGLLGAALVSAVTPFRRATLERVLRARATVHDPVAPFLAAPCHTRDAAEVGAPDVAVEAERPV